MNTFSLNMTRTRLTVSSSQLIMLNCTETRFLLFLKTLADMLMPVTFSSCLFLKLKKKRLKSFLAPTGALEEGILCECVCVQHFPQKNTANEFLKHSKESRGVLGQAGKQATKPASKQASK